MNKNGTLSPVCFSLVIFLFVFMGRWLLVIEGHTRYKGAVTCCCCKEAKAEAYLHLAVAR